MINNTGKRDQYDDSRSEVTASGVSANIFQNEADVYGSTIFDEEEDMGPKCGFRCDNTANWRCNKTGCATEGCGILFCNEHAAHFKSN